MVLSGVLLQQDVIPNYPAWVMIALVFGYILAMFAVGYYALRRRVDKSESEFFVTKWGTGWIGIAFSFAATFASAGYVLGTMGVFYDNPVALTGYVFGTMLAPIAWWGMARKMYVIGRRESYSTPTDLIGDFYQSERLRMLTSVVVIIFFVPYMAVNLIAPAELLEATTGGMVPYWVGLLLMAGVVFVYVFSGGMRGVILTDIVQGVLIYALFIAIIPILFFNAGGYSGIIQSIPDQVAYGQSGDTMNLWFIVIGWMLLLGLLNPALPDRTTRLYTAKNYTQLKRGIMASAVLLALFCLLNLHFGWSASAIGPQTEQIDMAIVELTGQYAYPLLGLLVVVLWAGGMSTLGSGAIGMAAMLTKDLYRKNVNPDASEEKIYNIGRVTVTALLVLALVLSFRPPDYLWEFIAATSIIAIQWLPLIFGALYWRRATKWGAYAGFVSGVTIAAVYTWILEAPIPGTGGALIPALVVNIILFVGVSLATDGIEDASHLRSFMRPSVPVEWL